MTLTDNSSLKAAVKTVPSLNEAQRDGRACIVCGRDDSEMVPVAGLHSDQSAQLFRCSTCEFDGDEALPGDRKPPSSNGG